MFTPAYFKLKKGKEQQARKIYLWAGIACVLLCLWDYFFMTASILRCLSDLVVRFIAISYCALGWARCYKTKRFKGHKILRWAALAIVSFYAILGIVLYFSGEIGIYMPALVSLAVALCLSITAVLNGYR